MLKLERHKKNILESTYPKNLRAYYFNNEKLGEYYFVGPRFELREKEIKILKDYPLKRIVIYFNERKVKIPISTAVPNSEPTIPQTGNKDINPKTYFIENLKQID